MNHLEQNYKIILETLTKLPVNFTPFTQIRRPKLSNIELIALNLTAEYMSIDSECQLFKLLKGTFLEHKIERSVYHRRRKTLFQLIHQTQQTLANAFNEFEDCFIVDSTPLKICHLARARRSSICTENEHTLPSIGFCAAKNEKIYGYKLHVVVSASGIVQHMDITNAAVHEVHFLTDLQHQLNQCLLIGDKGYISCVQQINLFQTAHIELNVPSRKNQRPVVLQPHFIRKTRKRIETFFSQLNDQFMIQRNYAKSFMGFKTRILSKITAASIIQFLNYFVFHTPVNHLKKLIT